MCYACWANTTATQRIAGNYQQKTRMKKADASVRNELTQRLRSFKHAATGIWHALGNERNLQIHCICSLLVLALACALKLDFHDWFWLIFAIVLVWSSELLNTAIEALCDVVSPSFHPGIKLAKDIAAGAVLICAVGATIIGAMVILPRLREVLS